MSETYLQCVRCKWIFEDDGKCPLCKGEAKEIKGGDDFMLLSQQEWLDRSLRGIIPDTPIDA